MSHDGLLQVRGLTRRFGGNLAVDGIDFDVKAGELLALIGPNGAGKSTTFNMINGQLGATAGSVRFDGQEILGRPSHQVARLGVGRSFQIAATFSSLTVLQNVQMALAASRRKVFSFFSRADEYDPVHALALLEQVGMAHLAAQPCGDLAYGDVKRLELAMSLAAEPRLLLMDEPTAGMAPGERNALVSLVKRIVRERQMGVLFTEHSMDVVFDHADRIIVLARGKLIAEGGPAHIREHPEVQKVYFGTNTGLIDEPERKEGAADPVSTDESGRPAQSDTEILLDVQELDAWYGAAQILRGVSLQVGRGEVVALMGRNGAGKSTTLKAVMGLVQRRAQRLAFMESPVEKLRPFEMTRRGMGYVPEDRRVFSELSVDENLSLGRQAPRYWPDQQPAADWSKDDLYELFPPLQPLRDRPAGTLSGGEQQMLTVARSLMGNPFLLLLDEPSEGVAPIVVEQMVVMIHALQARGTSILLSEQNLPFARLVAGRAYVLEKGVVRYTGGMERLLNDEDLKRQYLTL